MNSTIQKFYHQAHSIRHYDGDPAREGNPPTVYWQGEVSAERFAELIVRDCISQIALVAVPNWDNDEVSWAMETCIDNIKARYHLGVK